MSALTLPKKAPGRKPNTLTPMEKRFCHEYLIDLNKTAAARRTGYKDANNIGWKLFRKPHVQAYLLPLIEKINQATLATAERVLEELTCLAMSNVATFYKLVGKKWVLKELDELTSSQQRAISEIEPGKYIKLHSKDSALDKLAKHFKLYTDLEAGSASFNLLPVLRISGNEVIFEVGKPAPQARIQKI